MPSPAINLILRNSLDPDARVFAASSGATDVAALSAFAKGVKALGLWNSMVCWPMIASQSAGVGTSVKSFGGGGTFNATTANGPAWTPQGIVISTNTQTITASGSPATARPFSAITVLQRVSQNVDFRLREGFPPTGRNLEFALTSNVHYANIRTIATGPVALAAAGAFRFVTRVIESATTGSIYIDGSLTSTSGNSWDAASAPTNYVVAAGANTNPTTGFYIDSFHSVFAATLTSVQSEALRSLYKSTLGQGLGLI
jgi:hypothetical protein